MDIALIRMDDGKKNAMTIAGLEKINAALDEAETDAKAVVVAGRPGSFCAGFDLATMTGGDIDAITALGTNGGLLATRLYGMGMPIVAACTGHALTIGAFWLLACDTRIGETGNFKFGFNETAMGMVLPPWAMQTAAEMAALPAKAYAGNKLVPREAALGIMRADLGAAA